MLTKNAKRMLAAAFAMPDSNTLNPKCFIPVKNVSNEAKYAAPNTERWPTRNIYDFQLAVTNGGTMGIAVGSGTTAATDDDYNLESLINYSSISGYASVVNRSMVSGNPTVEILVSVNNISSSAITVSEIGYFAKIEASSTDGSTLSATNTILVDRSVLSNPVTIPAGGTANITYTITGDLS